MGFAVLVLFIQATFFIGGEAKALTGCGRCPLLGFDKRETLVIESGRYNLETKIKKGYDIFAPRFVVKHVFRPNGCLEVDFNCPPLPEALIYLRLANSTNGNLNVFSVPNFKKEYDRIVCDDNAQWVLSTSRGNVGLDALVCTAPRELIDKFVAVFKD